MRSQSRCHHIKFRIGKRQRFCIGTHELDVILSLRGDIFLGDGEHFGVKSVATTSRT